MTKCRSCKSTSTRHRWLCLYKPPEIFQRYGHPGWWWTGNPPTRCRNPVTMLHAILWSARWT